MTPMFAGFEMRNDLVQLTEILRRNIEVASRIIESHQDCCGGEGTTVWTAIYGETEREAATNLIVTSLTALQHIANGLEAAAAPSKNDKDKD